MASGAPFNGVLSLVPHVLIKPRGLEVVGRQDHLYTATCDSLGFSGTKEQGSEPLSPILLVDPKIRELAASSPGMAVEPGDHFAGIALMLPARSLPSKYPVAFALNS